MAELLLAVALGVGASCIFAGVALAAFLQSPASAIKPIRARGEAAR